MSANGIDATVELVTELDRLSATNSVANEAPRSKAIYAYLASGIATTSDSGEGSEFVRLTNHLILRLGVWWSADAYARMPTMTPWCVRDRSCRYDQGPESWGSPRADGYFRDDNSIIKKLPLTVSVAAPQHHPYRGRRPYRGFTACHIWRDLPGGRVAGEDPWLYSFMPNLVWLPSWIAPLTDRQGSAPQALLQRTSLEMFRARTVDPELRAYTEHAWEQLSPPTSGPALPLDQLATFEPDSKFFGRRVAYLDNVIAGCDSVLANRALSSKVVSSRYSAGLPTLEAATIGKFRDTMVKYRDASRVSLAR